MYIVPKLFHSFATILNSKRTMKKIFALFLALGLCSAGWAQTPPISHLDINNIRSTILGNGSIMPPSEWKSSTGQPNPCPWYEVPQGSGCQTLYQLSFWFGATDIAMQLHLAGMLYNNVGRDYVMGPVTLDYASSDFMTQLKYMRIWSLTRAEIDQFIAHHGESNYEMPKDILEWPAHGDEGFAPNLAPFVDVNGDGRYVPADGDYPDIKGDQCLFFIFNDACEHTETGGTPLRMEFHVMAYAFDAPDDEALDNTIFFNYKCYNRSTYAYSNCYTGFWADFDIGHADDDYAGCDVQRGSFYAYNATPTDGNGQPWAYGDNPPVQAVTILAGPRMDADGRDNPAFDGIGEHLFNEAYPNDKYAYNGVNFGNGIADDERLGLCNFCYQDRSGISSPETAPQYYSMMRMTGPDGSTTGYGCDYSGPPCHFMFPGDSDPLNFGTDGVVPQDGFNTEGKYWDMEYCEKQPYDCRGLGSMGPFSIVPGEMQEIDFALTTVWKNESQSAMERRGEFIDHVRAFFFNGPKK